MADKRECTTHVETALRVLASTNNTANQNDGTVRAARQGRRGQEPTTLKETNDRLASQQGKAAALHSVVSEWGCRTGAALARFDRRPVRVVVLVEVQRRDVRFVALLCADRERGVILEELEQDRRRAETGVCRPLRRGAEGAA